MVHSYYTVMVSENTWKIVKVSGYSIIFGNSVPYLIIYQIISNFSFETGDPIQDFILPKLLKFNEYLLFGIQYQ